MKHTGFKRVIGLVLAMAILSTATPFVTPAQAALTTIKVEFKEGTDKETTTVVVGNATEVDIKLLGGYMPAEPPFLIYDTAGNPVTDSGNKSIISYSSGSSNTSGTFTTRAGAAGTGSSTYTIRGQFYALVAEGEAVESWPAMFKDNTVAVPPIRDVLIDPAGRGVANIISTQSRGITKDSKISIVCIGEETTTTPPTFKVENNTGTGAFLGYDDVIVTRLPEEGGKKVLQVRLQKQGGSTLVLKLYPTQGHSVVTDWVDKPVGSGNNWTPVLDPKGSNFISENTKYDIDFVMPNSNNLLLRVITPQFWTDEIGTSVGGKPLDYVKLGSGDTLDWITNDFQLITEVSAYGATADIKWEWLANDPAKYKNVVLVKDGRSPVVAKIDQQEDDVTGVMRATITYDNKKDGVIAGTSTANVPVKIKGKGKPPYAQLKQEWIGINAPKDIAIGTAANNIKNLPTRMDVYDGTVAGFTDTAKYPFKMNATIHLGEKNAAAEHMIITSTNPNAVNVFVNGNLTPYKFGEKIPNPQPKGQGTSEILIVAKTGDTNTQLNFDFYGKVNGGAIELYQRLEAPNITVEDNTPSKDATLKAFEINSNIKALNGYNFDFGFKPSTNVFSITVPYATEHINVGSTVNDARSSSTIKVGDEAKDSSSVTNATVKEVKLEVGKVKRAEVTVTAQDVSSKQTYILNITRAAASKDSSLKSLKIFSEASSDATDLLKGFSSAKLKYDLHVPYGVKKVRVDVEETSPWVQDISILPKPVKEMFFSKTAWIDLGHANDTGGLTTNPTPITVAVKAEADNDAVQYRTTYSVDVTRDDPSENNMLKSLELLDNKGTTMPFKVGATEQKFVNNQRDYYININYSTEQIRLKAQPEHEYATGVTLVMPDGKTETIAYDGRKNTPVEFRSISIPKLAYPTNFKIKVFATAESGRPTTAADAEATTSSYYLYTIEITRNPADSDARLDTLTLTDQDGKAVDAFSFNAEKLEYDITVPYVTSNVTVTPKPKSLLSFATVNNLLITENRPFLSLPLTAGKKEVVTVIVEAESGDKKTYTLNITRGMPSAEARLELLSVPEGADFAPRFVPANTAYTVKLKEATRAYTVIAKPVDEYATIEINGKAAASNVAFGPITSVEESSKVTIKVTAQDGKTTKVYTITLTDENFIIKGDNPDLAALRIENGEMSPRFKPGIQDYEVYVKSETDWINVFPRPIDRNSTLEVFAGSKKLGDYYSDYSTAITDDTIDLSVKVTAPSGATKTYNAVVYRNNDEKQGKLRPITADMVNFEQASPIIVDISKYYVVSAEVINKMIEYPDKTIIFKGNDYSFEMRGKDLKELVPNTDLFDLSLKFSTSDEDRIWDIMDEESRNDDLEPVFVHFNHHGKLPAPFKLTLSLGREYQNRTLYWNYFNEERDRIDYYGTVRTNVKGTFTAMMTHMSDYIVTKRRIIGSENKESEATSYSYGLNTWMDEPKTNPNTGRAGVE